MVNNGNTNFSATKIKKKISLAFSFRKLYEFAKESPPQFDNKVLIPTNFPKTVQQIYAFQISE